MGAKIIKYIAKYSTLDVLFRCNWNVTYIFSDNLHTALTILNMYLNNHMPDNN